MKDKTKARNLFKNVRAILSSLQRVPLSAKEIAGKTILSLATVYRYLTDLEEYGFITKQKKLYQLTAYGRQLLEILSI